MTSPYNQLLKAATQLQQEGKTPNLALFKARLAGSLSAPQLFAAYQQWRNQPQSTPIAVDADEPQPDSQTMAPVTSALSTEQFASQLNRIEAKLDLLLQKLAD